ncbi:UNVERIFIED_CONTAM: hypothetical protein Slati_1508500 [Sesamum latifolium]|uniref:CCHC-type domain-containing protein n=1 Tax=Sesamum latifolium TaxID=2727402 RepID=A0AAW2X9C0_9LAMI
MKKPRLGLGSGKGVPTKRLSPTPHTQEKSAFPARPPFPYPLCGFCHRLQLGDCRWRIGACFQCGQVGHKVSECPQSDPRANTPVPRPRNPTPSQRSKGNPTKGNAGVFAMTQAEAANAEDVVIGTIIVDNSQAYALFDYGATHSFVSNKFAKHLNRARVSLNEPYRVATPGNIVLVTNLVYPNCDISLNGFKLNANLIQIKVREFDVILGMDWLACNFALVDSNGKIVNFHPLTFTIDTRVGQTKLEDIPKVREFPDVFPDDLPRPPPVREIDLEVNLVPKATPVSKTPYRIAPAELRELKKQLQELMDKKLISLVCRLGETLCCLLRRKIGV